VVALLEEGALVGSGLIVCIKDINDTRYDLMTRLDEIRQLALSSRAKV
jgi:hypothetical protein